MKKNEKDSRNVKKGKKKKQNNKSLPHPITTKESRGRQEVGGGMRQSKGRIPETAGAFDKMGAHTFRGTVPHFAVWLLAWREAGSLTG